MHATSADLRRQVRVCGDQQNQASIARQGGQVARGATAVRRAEVPVHNGGSARQPPRDRRWIGGSRWVGHEIEGRDRRRASASIELARKRR